MRGGKPSEKRGGKDDACVHACVCLSCCLWLAAVGIFRRIRWSWALFACCVVLLDWVMSLKILSNSGVVRDWHMFRLGSRSKTRSFFDLSRTIANKTSTPDHNSLISNYCRAYLNILCKQTKLCKYGTCMHTVILNRIKWIPASLKARSWETTARHSAVVVSSINHASWLLTTRRQGGRYLRHKRLPPCLAEYRPAFSTFICCVDCIEWPISLPFLVKETFAVEMSHILLGSERRWVSKFLCDYCDEQ